MNNDDISLIIVESDEAESQQLKELASKTVGDIRLAKNPGEAKELYYNRLPDIILTDCDLNPGEGFEFLKQIKASNSPTRFIVISNNTSPDFFIRLISNGIQGFLQKPVTESSLNRVMKELIKSIRIEKDLESEEQKRVEAEIERDKSEQILKTLSQATALFFRYGLTDQNTHRILKLIGKATDSNRVNIFRNFEEDGELYTGVLYTWASHTRYKLEEEALRKIPYGHEVMNPWAIKMRKGQSIHGIVYEFPSPQREMLVSNGVVSLLTIPIFVDEKWWGFISLDDCENEKNWSPKEVQAMETLTYNLGAAIYRVVVERELERINEQLEARVKERTAALEKEIEVRKMAEELLRESEEKYRIIYENASDGILLIQDKKIVLTNPSMVEIMERLPREMIGREFCEFVDPKHAQKVRACLSDKKKNQRSNVIAEVTIPGKENKCLELKVTRITWDNNPAQLIFATDTTLRVKAEKKLNKLNRSLASRIKKEVEQVRQQQLLLIQKSKLESLGELSAGLAHEINQPLMSISLGLDNILLAVQDNQLSKEYLENKIEIIFKDIDRIKQIIEHVRTFSRSHSQKNTELIEINTLIKNVLLLVEKMMNDKDTRFEVKLCRNKAYVQGNPYRLEQVILNLLSNAKHAVEAREKAENGNNYRKRVGLEVRRLNGKLCICISDNGIGIPKEVLPKIFDPFFTTKDEEKGTGLGLSISYGIIQEMNGTIEVDSRQGDYTHVKVLLPIENQEG